MKRTEIRAGDLRVGEVVLGLGKVERILSLSMHHLQVDVEGGHNPVIFSSLDKVEVMEK